jgi:hypothetical protein
MRKLIPLGEGLRVYRISKNPEATFGLLAGHLMRERDTNGLRTLIGEHRGRAPADPQIALYEGDLARLEGRLFEAEEHYRRAEARPDKETISPVEGVAELRLLGLALRKGQVLERYRSGGGDPERFQFLAAICIQEKSSAALDALLDAHRARFPRDPSLNAIAAKADILRGDWEAAWKRMTPADLRSEAEREDAIVCLIRLKRLDDALAVVRDWEANTRMRFSPLPAILAHAAAGNAKDVERLMTIHAYHDQNLARFYRDEILGPLLRGEAMASVRERFPEAKK